jgi:hypothetical protein
MKPKRIQRKRTKGWKNPPNTVYVGRPTKFGNPFVAGKIVSFVPLIVALIARAGTDFYHELETGIKVRDVNHSLLLYKKYITIFNKGYIRGQLRGKNLSCWCKIGDPCHADILLKIANK